MNKIYYVYILLCSDNSYYVGVTNNIPRRLDEHSNGLEKSGYTFNRRPISLVYSEMFRYIDRAIAREKQLKGWSRKKKEALIGNNPNSLRDLSKKKFD